MLAVDTARTSGWAIRRAGKLVASGEVKTLKVGAIMHVISSALDAALDGGGLPLVIVLERSYGGTHTVVSGLGAARERWLVPWCDVGLSRKRVVSVYPASWRARVLGKGYASAGRDVVRRAEFAAALALDPKAGAGRVLGGDECAAILISRWATYAGEVGAVLDVKVRARSLPLPAAGQLTLVYGGSVATNDNATTKGKRRAK